jgi:hypothetical protein
MNVCRWFSVIFVLLVVSTGVAQEVRLVEGKSKPRITADSLFIAGKWAQALPIYKELSERFPQDYYYSYTVGVCYMNSTRRAEVAIPYLSKAVTGDVPDNVYFYLAEAYRKVYKFDKAIELYRRFMINGGSSKIKVNEVEKGISNCENGNSLLQYIFSPQVVDKKRVSLNDFYQYYSLVSDLGSFIKKPSDLMTAVDLKQKDSSIIFYPKNLKTGDYIYYSSYGKSTLYARDIYRIKRLDDGYWSKPENLGQVVNSAEDDDFPYMSSDGVTLYFASKGHYSMGGYDIYRSVFDPNSKKWSTPENIGFPFSSPYDDILYLSDVKDSLACFATNRGCEGDSLDIVMYKVDNNPIRRSFTSVEEVSDISQLKIANEKVAKNDKLTNESQNKQTQAEVSKPKTKSASFNSVENDPEYIRVITNGFSKQKETDSLRIKLEKLRERFDYITTAEERKALESKVVKVENALLTAQNEADKMFTRASQIEQEYLTGKRKSEGNTNASFTNDNPDFLYQAQFAPTVFRTDEIEKLKQIEKLQNQINSARNEVVSSKTKYESCSSSGDSLADCKALYNLMIKNMNGYNSLIAKWYDVKYKIYSDCVLVALVKSGNNNRDEAKVELDRANSHFRSALAIKNNLSDEGRSESLYEASLLNELGILRLEIAFARTWGMNLFEQETTSKAIKLEKIAFGNPLAPTVVSVATTNPQVKAEPKQEIGISKVVSSNINTEPILIINDEPPAFEVVEQSPYDAQNPIPVNEEYPKGVIYKIQLGAYSKPLEIASFKGMVPVSIESVSGAKVSKYYIGKFKKFADADKSLPIVRSKGYKDAFIVAWFDGKSIPLTRAQSMEDKQVTKLSPKIKVVSDSTSVKGRIYIVEIGKYSSKLPDNIYQTIKAMAAGKDIVRKPNEQGQMVYSIGNYPTMEEATRVKDNLIASGISSAIVLTVEIEK